MEEGEWSHSHSPVSPPTSPEGVNEGGAVAGRVKVHLMYDRRSESLTVMIRHVKDLVSEPVGGGARSHSPDPTPGSEGGERLG